MHRRVQGLPNVDTALLFVEGSRASGGHVLTQAIPRAESDSAEAWVRAAAEVDRSWPVHRVAAFTDRHIGFASVIAQRLNVPYHDPATVAAVNDKLVMRERLIRAGVDLTPAAVAEGIAELANFGRQHGYPMILKPAGGTASSGIAQINEAGDIPGAFRKVCAAWPTGRLLVEAWLPGEEFSVECFSSRGIHKIVGLTRKFKDQITFVETGHQIPAGLSKTDAERLAVFVCRCLTALGVRDGPTHSEVMIHGDDIHLIETHLRMGGDYIPELLASTLR